MEKNEEIIIKIDSYGDNGEGVGRYQGFAVFVPFAIMGETVKAKIILKKKNFAVGKIIEIITPSKNRISPVCENFTKCGGCQLMHIDNITQSEYKERIVKDKFQRIAKVETEIEKIVVGEKKERYRNKLQLPIGNGDYGIIAGFYAPYSHRIVKINDCLLQDERNFSVFNALKNYADKNKIKGYDEKTKKGLLRHLVIRSTNKDLLITIVINGKELPKKEELIDELNKLKLSFGLYVNENRENTNVIFGKNFTHIYGLKKLQLKENGINFSITPQTFIQVNDEIRKELYKKAIELLDAKKSETVINCYSGAGYLTAAFSKESKFSYGIEIVKEGTMSADELKKNNNIENMENITGDVEKVLPMLIKKIEGDIAVVFDPPRKGVDENTINAVLSVAPKKIIYISCNPATLARDIFLLKEKYDIKKVIPFDMFPATSQVEVLTYLEKK